MIVDSLLLLLAAPLIGIGIGMLGWFARRSRLRATALWSPGSGGPWVASGRMTPWLFGAAGLLGGIGLAGPRWGTTLTELETRALNLAIGIDISRSMLAEDVAPSRLVRAIGETRRLVQDAGGDRLALLAFSSRSYILAPLTLDAAAVSVQLDALDPDVASEGGTDLGTVLTQGAGLLSAAPERGARVLVVFTDGETHDSLDAALAAARAAQSAGITLIMVGEGDTIPARIPLRNEQGALVGFKTDTSGETIYTWRRDDVLQRVADAAGGTLISATTTDQAGTVRRILEGLERSASRELHRADLTPRGWLFGLGALVLLAVQGVLRRGPAIAVLALAILSGASTALAQRPSQGDKLLARSDTLAAAAAYAREAVRGGSPDSAYYNAGTAALLRARFEQARTWLGLAARSLDPELRFRALFNLGLAGLQEGRQDSARRGELHQEAAGRFREALLLQPASRDAKWNLELVQPPIPPPSGGGGGGASPPRTPQAPRPAGGTVSSADAEQILNSVERAEREIRAEQSRRRRLTRTASVKDW